MIEELYLCYFLCVGVTSILQITTVDPVLITNTTSFGPFNLIIQTQYTRRANDSYNGSQGMMTLRKNHLLPGRQSRKNPLFLVASAH